MKNAGKKKNTSSYKEFKEEKVKIKQTDIFNFVRVEPKQFQIGKVWKGDVGCDRIFVQHQCGQIVEIT